MNARATRLSLIFIALFGHVQPATSAGSDFFNGKAIDYVVGSKPGGGYDSFARLIAPVIESNLPGSTVVVKNEPAGGGAVALDEIAARAPDGLAIMSFNTGLLLSQLAGQPDIDFDLRTLSYLGKAGSEARILIVRKDLGIDNFAKLQTSGRELVFTASGFGSASHVETQLLKRVFGLNMRVLTGFGGSEAEAALIKGESDGGLVSESNVGPLLDAGAVVPLARFGTASDPRLANVPDGVGLAVSDDQKLVVHRISIMSTLGRITATTPGVPAAVLADLRNAYGSALNDPALLAEAERRGLPIDFLDGDSVAKLVNEFLAPDPRYSELLAEIFKE